MKFEYSDFRKGHCEQYNTKPEIFIALWKHTKGDPCTTGCPWWGRGQCLGYKRLIRAESQKRPKQGLFKTYNNADLAEKLNVSKRQISKMRKAGTLNEMLENRT